MAAAKLGQLPTLQEPDALAGRAEIRFEVERGAHCQHSWNGIHWHIVQYGVPAGERDRIEALFQLGLEKSLYFTDGVSAEPVEVAFGTTLRVPQTDTDERSGDVRYDLEYEVHATRVV